MIFSKQTKDPCIYASGVLKLYIDQFINIYVFTYNFKSLCGFFLIGQTFLCRYRASLLPITFYTMQHSLKLRVLTSAKEDTAQKLIATLIERAGNQDLNDLLEVLAPLSRL
jgi:hypothetical protein